MVGVGDSWWVMGLFIAKSKSEHVWWSTKGLPSLIIHPFSIFPQYNRWDHPQISNWQTLELYWWRFYEGTTASLDLGCLPNESVPLC